MIDKTIELVYKFLLSEQIEPFMKIIVAGKSLEFVERYFSEDIFGRKRYVIDDEEYKIFFRKGHE